MTAQKWRILLGKKDLKFWDNLLPDRQTDKPVNHQWGLDQRISTYALLSSKTCSVRNPKVWKLVGLQPSSFDDTSICWHGSKEHGHALANHTWIHLSPRLDKKLLIEHANALLEKIKIE